MTARIFGIALVALLVACALPAAAGAASFDWKGGTGSWQTSTNWTVTGTDADGVPDADDDVTVNSGTVTVDAPASARSFSIAGGATRGGTAQLDIAGGTGAPTSVIGSASFVAGRTVFGPDSDLRIDITWQIKAGAVAELQGTVGYGSSGGIQLGGTAAESGGTLEIGTLLDLTTRHTGCCADAGGGLVKNLADGTIRYSGTNVVQFAPPVQNAGTIDVDSGTVTMRNGLTQTAGLIDVAAGALLREDEGGGAFDVQSGVVQGGGTVGQDLINSGGTVKPGASPGTLTIEDDYTQGPNGTLEAEIDGTTAGTQYDQLLVGGDASLGGTLALVTGGGFDPPVGSVFDIVTVTSNCCTVSGQFAQLTGAQLSGKHYDDQYETRKAQVAVVGEPPANTGAPSISGEATEEQTLTCSPGTWTGSPTLSFEWLRDGAPIAGATSQTYTLTSADVGREIRCRVTATNSNGSTQAISGPVTPAAKPQPEPQPQPQPQPSEPPAGPACRDRDKPSTRLRKRGVRRRGGKLVLNGSARDAAGACASGVQRVQVSLAAVARRTCRFVRFQNRFRLTPVIPCRRPILFTATGTDRWSFTFDMKLPPGKYRVQARAIDGEGNKEDPKQGRNIVSFTVR